MERPPRDPNTLLQEWAQGRSLPLPNIGSSGRAARTTRCSSRSRFMLPGMGEVSATASSKRAAETGAAAALLERLGNAVGV